MYFVQCQLNHKNYSQNIVTLLLNLILHLVYVLDQGNGHETDFLGKESNVFIMDVYNSNIYPRDHKAEAAIRCKVKLASFTEDREYLATVKRWALQYYAVITVKNQVSWSWRTVTATLDMLRPLCAAFAKDNE